MNDLPVAAGVRWSPWFRALALGWWVWLAWMVLHSLPPRSPNSCWVICESSFLPDMAGNIAVFCVATFLLVRAGVRGDIAGLSGILLALTAETLQWTVLVGRHPSVFDFVGGSVGSLLGVLLAGVRIPEVSVRTRWAVLALAWGGWLGLLGLTSWAFLPALTSGPAGVVVTPYGREMGLVATPEVSDNSVTITGTFTASSPGGYRTLAVIVGDEGWIAEVAVSWRGLVFGTMINGGSMGLPTAGLHLIRTLPQSGVEQVRFVASRSRRTWSLEASRAGWSERIEARSGPFWGWVLFYPVRYAMGWERHFITILFAIGITMPLGFLTGWVGASRSLVLVSAAFVGLGLGVVPWALGAPIGPAWQWLIAGSAFMGGILASGLRVRFPNP